MKTKTVLLSIGGALVLVVLVLVFVMRHEAAVLVVNGTFHTVNSAKPIVQAVAIREGRILGMGTTEEIKRSYTAPTLIDLHGAPVYPGFIDSHAHLEGLGAALMTLDLAGATSVQDVQAMPHNAKGTADPPGGRIIEPVLPPPTRAERMEAISRAVARCLSVGLTEVHDMGVDLEGIQIYKEMIQAGRFPFRVYAVIGGTGETWDHYKNRGPEIGGFDDKLTVRALKLYADGALGSRGAALVEPYSDEPDNRGLTLTSRYELTLAAQDCAEKGFQLCVHASGDRANTMVLTTYEELFNQRKINGLSIRFRVEHAQVLMPDDIGRFARLGVLPMMQPARCTSDMYWAEDRLGPKRVLGAYAWRSLLDSGSIIPAGSDFPVEDPNPMYGFHAAITRQDLHDLPPGGWYPAQRMTRDEALKAFTIWGAYAGFQEKDLGTIEPGKWADMTVLSKDIMAIAPEEIPGTVVTMTFVAGVVAFEQKVAD
jgi:predicted amidohydrolase YtcJ